MAFDEQMADRLRIATAGMPGISEKKMFGGLAFLLNGNMFCGIVDTKLMLRVGAESYKAILAKPHISEMDFTGKPMTGFVYVEQQGFATDKKLKACLQWAYAYVSELPVK